MKKERVIAYARVSSQQQSGSDKSSHAYQEERIRLACEARGYQVVRVLKEVDKRWELDREQLMIARQAIRDGEADILMAMVMDRLASEAAHLYIIKDDIERAGGRVEFADQEFADTPEGELLLSVAQFMSKVEVLRISRRSKQGYHSQAMAGLPVGRRPLGYRIVGEGRDRHYELDPVEAPIARRIFSDVAEGVPIRQILADLTAEGHKTSLSKTVWHGPSLHRIIHNTIYKGTWRGKKTSSNREKVNGQLKRVTRQNPIEEQGPEFTAPPIVSVELWDRANARLKLNADESPRNTKNRKAGLAVVPETHLLRAPFGKCGECGYSLVAIKASEGRRARYRCGNSAANACSQPSIRQPLLDNHVWAIVEQVINNPGQAVKKLVDQATDGTLVNRIADAKKHVAALEKQSDGLGKGIAKAWGNNDESLADLLTEQRKPIITALSAARAEQAELENQLLMQEELAMLPSHMEALLKEDTEAFKNLTYAAKRNLLLKLNLRAELFSAVGRTAEDELGLTLDRVRVTMKPTADLLYGWDEDDGDWDIDAEEPVGEALNILGENSVTAKPNARITRRNAQSLRLIWDSRTAAD